MRAIDALHTEMLVDVQQLVSLVSGLKEDLPKIAAELGAHAGEVKSATQATRTEVQAMGEAFAAVIGKTLEAERKASRAARVEAEQLTKATLEGFTKYFWLLCGLVGLQAVLLIIVLVRFLASK